MHEINFFKQKGFTLIELSIVMVIIGLVIGGIITGKELIRGTNIRATISQITKYNSALNTFNLKYSGIPGDMINAATYVPGVLNGDGDGLLGTIMGGGPAPVSVGLATNQITGFNANEMYYFWYTLATLGLIQVPNVPNAILSCCRSPRYLTPPFTKTFDPLG